MESVVGRFRAVGNIDGWDGRGYGAKGGRGERTTGATGRCGGSVGGRREGVEGEEGRRRLGTAVSINHVNCAL